MKLVISMLYRSIWIRSLHSTCRAILQSFHISTLFEVLLNDDVYAVEIVPSEVACLPVKVKGIKHMKVFKSYSKFFLSVC